MLSPGSFSRPSDHGPDAKAAECHYCWAQAEASCDHCGEPMCPEHRKRCIGPCSDEFCTPCAQKRDFEYSLCGICPEDWAPYEAVLPLGAMYTRVLLYNRHLRGLMFLDWTEKYLDLDIWDTNHVPACRVEEIRAALLKLLPEGERKGFKNADQ